MAEPEEEEPESADPGTLGSPASETPDIQITEVMRSPVVETNPSSDTLLSAPTPATRDELALDNRLSTCERTIEELLIRAERLERRPAEPAPAADRSWWFWLVFLAGLALAWQILAQFR